MGHARARALASIAARARCSRLPLGSPQALADLALDPSSTLARAALYALPPAPAGLTTLDHRDLAIELPAFPKPALFSALSG